jgi:hypothetical protein
MTAGTKRVLWWIIVAVLGQDVMAAAADSLIYAQIRILSGTGDSFTRWTLPRKVIRRQFCLPQIKGFGYWSDYASLLVTNCWRAVSFSGCMKIWLPFLPRVRDLRTAQPFRYFRLRRVLLPLDGQNRQ